MMGDEATRLQNIGIFAHIDAGKTTVTEQLLYMTGSVRFAGSVEDGSTVTDWQVAEQQRGITIGSAAVTCRWNGTDITVVDTPGHVDFTVEVERTLRVIEGGVVIINGPEGIQAQTETVWHQAARYGLPVIGFLNRLDRLGVDLEGLEKTIRDRFGIEPLPLQLPVVLHGEPDTVGIIDVLSGELRVWDTSTTKKPARRPEVRPLDEDQDVERQVALERVVDVVTAVDDALAERVLAGETPTAEELWTGLATAVARRDCFPLFAGAARTGAGLFGLADAIVRLLPDTSQMRPQRRFDAASGMEAPPLDDCSTSDATAAFIFKTELRRDGRRLAYVRVYSGVLRPDQALTRLPGAKDYTSGQLVRLFGGAEDEVDALPCGTIGGILSDHERPAPTTGETLAGEGFEHAFEPLSAPSPVISMTLEAEDAEAEAILHRALVDLITDDPSLSLGTDPATARAVLSGMGELHLELALERLRARLGDKVRAGKLKPDQRRIPTVSASGTGEAGAGTSPARHVAVKIVIEPVNDSSETVIAFADALADHPWRGPLEAGVETALRSGDGGPAFAGTRATIVELETTASDPFPGHFVEAAQLATREALEGAAPVVAEPWMDLRLVVPDEHVGPVVGDLSRRRGSVRSSEARGPLQVLHAEAPLAELIGYATDFRSLTGGRGLFTMEPQDYRQAG